MGGVSLLLYGVIGASGIRVLIESKVDYNKAQNLILTSVILIIGVSGAKVHRRSGAERHGAGDHRGDRPEPAIQRSSACSARKKRCLTRRTNRRSRSNEKGSPGLPF